MPAIMPKKVRISQEAFDAAVQENIDDFGMEPEEAVEDAVKTFQMQNVDLTGIVTKPGGAKSLEDHQAVQAVRSLEAVLRSEGGLTGTNNKDSLDAATSALERISLECSTSDEKDNNDLVAVVGKTGGIQAVIAACRSLQEVKATSAAMERALEALTALLKDGSNRDLFLDQKGPEPLTRSLTTFKEEPSISGKAAAAIAAACLKSEGNKVAFMELKAEVRLLQLLEKYQAEPSVVEGACAALSSFAVSDDTRPLASKAFAHARATAEAGAVAVLLSALRHQRDSPPVAAVLCNTLSTVAANDKICKEVAELGGIDLILGVLKSPPARQNALLARSACGLLRQLAASDENKDAVVDQGGLDLIVATMATHSADPALLQLGLAALAALTLRNPRNADLALRTGCVDAAVEAMGLHAGSSDVQRQACILIRNMAVRNVDNRPLILEKGVEPLLRKAKSRHSVCKDVGAAALRDLGFDDYNS